MEWTVADSIADKLNFEHLTITDLDDMVGTEISVDMPTRPDGSWTRVTVELTRRLADKAVSIAKGRI